MLIGAGVLALYGCGSAPDYYAPPEQVAQLEEFRPYRSSRMVEMGPAQADRFIVSDVMGSSGTWRWTGRRPTLRLNVRTNKDLRYIVDFALADATFGDTGPVNVTFWVNDHKLGEMYLDQPGEQHFEAAVPEDWVEPESDVLAAAEVDKVWVAPTDGVELGLILTRMGLVQGNAE